MSHDMEIANLMAFANAEGLNITQRALLRQAAERLEWCDERIFALEQAARPEPAQAQVTDAEIDAARAAWNVTIMRAQGNIDEIRHAAWVAALEAAARARGNPNPFPSDHPWDGVGACVQPEPPK